MLKKKILVVAPHADDEVLGIGGYVYRSAQAGHTVDLVIGAMGGVQHSHLAAMASMEGRLKEMNAAADILGFRKREVLFEGKDMELDTISQKDIITKLDKILDGEQYDEFFMACPSHNMDHQMLFKACWASLRIKPEKPLINFIASYEYPFVSWTYEQLSGGKLYVDITSNIEIKEKALRCYESQLRKDPSPCSVSGMRRLANARGLESGCEFAELLYIHRQII